jgi:hypothetical protein
MFTSTAHPGVKLLKPIWDVMLINQSQIFTLYISLIRAKPHIRFPKFTYVDEKFLDDFGE